MFNIFPSFFFSFVGFIKVFSNLCLRSFENFKSSNFAFFKYFYFSPFQNFTIKFSIFFLSELISRGFFYAIFLLFFTSSSIVESPFYVIFVFILFSVPLILVEVLKFFSYLLFNPFGQLTSLNFFITILESIAIFLPFILAVAYITLMERKVLASIQLRRGPDTVGPFGLFQPLADGFKLLLKELVTPYVSNKSIFIISPILTFFFAFFGLSLLPFYHFEILFDVELSLILFFGLSTLGIYGIILSGWASNSRYAFLGSLRSTAQLISYEVSLGLVIQTVALPCSSISFIDIVQYQQHNGFFIFPFFVTFVLFVISTFAETNRPPFDLPEAEAELVSGYNVEYSSSTFALFFIGEYANLITSTVVTVFFFFGGHCDNSIFGPFDIGFKIIFFLGFFLFIRAALPRFRYDQLIQFGWKGILPISFGWFCLTLILFYFICN
jgi:NADH-quinone oxidoreductase subunit H